MKKSILFVFIATVLMATPSRAEWTWGLGYHNPPSATAGINFMYLWTDWAFELGFGYIGANEAWSSRSDEKSTVYTIAGDVNLKYLFGSGGIRPYLMGGFGVAAATSTSGSVGIGTGVSHPFGGVGIMLGSGPYFYVSYLFVNAEMPQAGIAFPF